MTTQLPTNRIAPSPAVEAIPLGGPVWKAAVAAVGAGGTCVSDWIDVGPWGGARAQALVALLGGVMTVDWSPDDAHGTITAGAALPAVVAAAYYDSGLLAPPAGQHYARFTYTQAGGGASGAFWMQVLVPSSAGGGGGGGGGGGAITGPLGLGDPATGVGVTERALQGSLPAPNPADVPVTATKPEIREPDGALRTRARVLTDEGAYEGVFPGATLYTAVNGGMIIVGGTNVWSRANTITPLRIGDYVEIIADHLDTAPKMAQIDTINAGGLSGTLRATYAGAGSAVLAPAQVSDFVVFCTGNLNDVVGVGASGINLQVGIVNGARCYIARQLGAGGVKGAAPVRIFFDAQIDHRRANQAIMAGLVDVPAAYAAVNQIAAFLFDGIITTRVKTFAGTHSTLGAVNAYTLPGTMDSVAHPTGYELCIYEDRVEWWVVDMNDNHYERIAQWGVWYPDPYQTMWFMVSIENTGVPAGNSMISVYQINEKSLNFVDARVVSSDEEKFRATVFDRTPFVTGTPRAPTSINDNLVHELTLPAGGGGLGMDAGKHYLMQQIGGADLCYYVAAGAAPAVATVRNGPDLFNGIPWEITCFKQGERVWVVKAVDGTADASVKFCATDGGAGA